MDVAGAECGTFVLVAVYVGVGVLVGVRDGVAEKAGFAVIVNVGDADGVNVEEGVGVNVGVRVNVAVGVKARVCVAGTRVAVEAGRFVLVCLLVGLARTFSGAAGELLFACTGKANRQTKSNRTMNKKEIRVFM